MAADEGKPQSAAAPGRPAHRHLPAVIAALGVLMIASLVWQTTWSHWPEALWAGLRSALLLLMGALWYREYRSVWHRERERDDAEQELHRKKSHYRAVLDSSLDPLITIDAGGVIRSASRAVEPTLGWRPEELVGRRLGVLMPEPHQSRYGDYLQRYLRTGESSVLGRSRELTALRRDGSSFPCELRVARVDVPGEPEPVFAGTIRDISERQQLELQLRQVQRLESVGQLAAGIAHEINTPMQYVGDNVSFFRESFAKLAGVLAEHKAWIARDARTGLAPELACKARERWAEEDLDFLLEEVPTALGQTQEGVSRVSTIVRAMKEFSHPGRPEKSSVDVHKALQSTIEVSRHEWREVAEVVTEFDPELPAVPGYSNELNQVFLNLLVNAAHAVKDASAQRPGLGRITIRTSHTDDHVEVRLRDTGTGIPESVRGRIFEPFFTTKEVGRGTGQGLAIARSVVVEKHGGTIDFETEPGKGTTFILRFPRTSSGTEETS